MTPLATINPTKATTLTVRNTSTLVTATAKILLYGKTKAGKTSTAVTLEEDPKRNAIICTQPESQLGHLRALGIPYVIVRTFDEIKQAMTQAQTLFPNLGTLIIDDYTEAVDIKRAHEEAINGRTGDGVFVTYRSTMTWAGNMLRDLMDLPFNLVITAFERELKEEGSVLQWIGPDLPPSTASVVMAKFDFILHISNYQLRLKADTTKRIMAGNRFPIAKAKALPDLHEPNLLKLWNTYQQAIR